MTAAEQLSYTTTQFKTNTNYHYTIVDDRIDDYNLSIFDKEVFRIIQKRAGIHKDGCYQSKKNIAAELGIGIRKVFHAIKNLLALNMIRKGQQRRKSLGNFDTMRLYPVLPQFWLPQKSKIPKNTKKVMHDDIEQILSAVCTERTPSYAREDAQNNHQKEIQNTKIQKMCAINDHNKTLTRDIDIDLELAIANELASKNTHTYFDYNFSNELYDTPILLDNESSQNKSEEIGFNDEKVVINAIVLDDANDELKTNLYTFSDSVLIEKEEIENFEIIAKENLDNTANLRSSVTSLTLIPRNIIPKRDNTKVFKDESKAVVKQQSRKLHLTYSLEKEIKNIGIQLSLTTCKTYRVPFIDNFMCKNIITNVFSDINDLDAIRNAIDDIPKYRHLTNTSNKEIMTNDLINWINNKEQILQKREEEDKIQKELAENRIKETEMFLKINETNKEIEAIKKSEENIRVENFVKSLPIEFQEKYMKYSKSNRRTFKRELEELGEENLSRMINSEIDTEKLKQGRIELFKNNIVSVSY